MKSTKRLEILRGIVSYRYKAKVSETDEREDEDDGELEDHNNDKPLQNYGTGPVWRTSVFGKS